jgi:hypothetical protein
VASIRLLLPCLIALTTACSTATTPPQAPSRGLRAFADEAELTGALERWRSAALQLQAQRRERSSALSLSGAPAPAAKSDSSAQGTAAAESITNVQTAGVDEGGIVKQAGEHLLILRRGRLFTVKVGGGDLRPVASIDAYAPGADPRGAWYDELLVSGDTAVVIGYSYQRGGTEIGLFDIGRDGSLAYRATYHLRSQDYYSSRNYASRLVGRKLVLYTPTVLHAWWGAPLIGVMPSMRRWQAQMPEDFRRILPATRIYRSDDEFDPTQPLALHTVSSCDLAATPLRCESSAVLGPMGRVFYVSQGSVYVWAASGRSYTPVPRPAPAESLAVLYRLPLDGGVPSGIKTVGMPIDQLSFLEERQHLNVLLRDSGSGEGMFGAERGAARLALLRLPLSALGDGRSAAAREHYRRLPGGDVWPLQNRHVGDWLLWGSGQRAWALRPASGDEATELNPGHAVERIEALGEHALLAGNRGDELRFSALRLNGRPALAGTLGRPGARQGETRTHGFFYRPLGAAEGLLGLPLLADDGGRRSGIYRGGAGAASVVFVRQRDLQFQGLGELAATRRDGVPNDGCKASCVDWYGNARPIFLGERIFALMGYELVEGSLGWGGEAIVERRRIDFMPYATSREGRPSPFQ